MHNKTFCSLQVMMIGWGLYVYIQKSISEENKPLRRLILGSLSANFSHGVELIFH